MFNIYVYIYMFNLYMYIYINVNVYIYIYVFKCIHIYMCIYIYMYIYIYICVRVFTEASLEVKLPTIWTQMKSRDGKSQRTEEKKKEAQKEKVSKHFVFPMICGSGGSKSRLAKAAGAEPAAGQMR